MLPDAPFNSSGGAGSEDAGVVDGVVGDGFTGTTPGGSVVLSVEGLLGTITGAVTPLNAAQLLAFTF